MVETIECNKDFKLLRIMTFCSYYTWPQKANIVNVIQRKEQNCFWNRGYTFAGFSLIVYLLQQLAFLLQTLLFLTPRTKMFKITAIKELITIEIQDIGVWKKR